MDYQTLAAACGKKHTFTNVLSGFNAVELHRMGRIFPDSEEQAIEEKWKEIGAGKRNETLVALFPYETQVQEGVLQISGYATDFKHYIVTKDMEKPKVWLTGPSAVTRLIGGDEPVFVFGERKSKNLNTGGKLEFVPGGYLKAAHLSTSDPFRSTLEEELEEETGIGREHIADMKPLWYGKLATFPDGRACRNVVLDYLLDVQGITPEAVEQQFRAKEREHTRLDFVQKGALLGYLEANLEHFNTRGYCTIEQLVKRGLLR